MAEKCKKGAKGYKANPTKQAMRKQAKLLKHCKANPFDSRASLHLAKEHKVRVTWADFSAKGRKVYKRKHIVEAKRIAHREQYLARKEMLKALSEMAAA